jgi:methionine-rich copper-binding protein CopC
MRNLKIFLLSVGLVFSGAQSAIAHAEVVKSFPLANSTLTKSPKYVQLEFSEVITTLKSKNANSIVVLDAKARKITTSMLSVKQGIARIEFVGTLKPGKYTVKYRIVSADGHVLNAQFKFTLS